MYLLSWTTYLVSSMINIPYQSKWWTYLTHCYPQRIAMYIKVHSFGCSFVNLGQMNTNRLGKIIVLKVLCSVPIDHLLFSKQFSFHMSSRTVKMISWLGNFNILFIQWQYFTALYTGHLIAITKMNIFFYFE